MKSTKALTGAFVVLSCLAVSTSVTYAAFTPGNIYVAGSRNAQVLEFDPSLNLVSQWTHASFGTVLSPPGQAYQLGPAGMAFDAQGNLVVAGLEEFCVFSAPNVLVACHPKMDPEPTENIIFDTDANLYTTTSTGGTNEIKKYDADFNFVTTFSMPTGDLTGLTCDPDENLYIASQDCGCIYKVDRTTFKILDTITGIGTGIEGIQFTQGGDLLVGTQVTGPLGAGILRIRLFSPLEILDFISDLGLFWPVPVTIDNAGNYYTADYENGDGSLPADLFIFDASGNLITAKLPSVVFGPFGMVVAGTNLPCGAVQQTIPTLTRWGTAAVSLLLLLVGITIILGRRRPVSG